MLLSRFPVGPSHSTICHTLFTNYLWEIIIMKHYDQTLQEDTLYACTIYTMLHIIKYDYGVIVPLD